VASTYEPIQSTTLGSAASSITFSSIPSTYTDLRIILNGVVNADSYNPSIRFNSDTGSNYSQTRLVGRPSTAESDRGSSGTYIIGSAFTITNLRCTVTIDVMSYANTNVNKTVLISFAAEGTIVARIVGLWRSTAAITDVVLRADAFASGQFTSGYTASLYGIKAA
jgi:hypothetical protein